MWEHELSQKELELIELLKQNEMTRSQAAAKGYNLSRVFLLKCHDHGIPVYESDENDLNKKYGVIKQGVNYD